MCVIETASNSALFYLFISSLFDGDGDNRAVRGRLSPAQGAFLVHVQARPFGGGRDQRVLVLLQFAAILRDRPLPYVRQGLERVLDGKRVSCTRYVVTLCLYADWPLLLR